MMQGNEKYSIKCQFYGTFYRFWAFLLITLKFFGQCCIQQDFKFSVTSFCVLFLNILSSFLYNCYVSDSWKNSLSNNCIPWLWWLPYSAPAWSSRWIGWCLVPRRPSCWRNSSHSGRTARRGRPDLDRSAKRPSRKPAVLEVDSARHKWESMWQSNWGSEVPCRI